MEKLISEFSVGLFFWQSVLFLVLIFFLRKFAWKPILSAVESRENFIQESLEAAEKAKIELENLEAANEELLKKAREERDELLKEAKVTKDRIIAEAKAKGQEEFEKKVASAVDTIRNEKALAFSELKSHVAELSIEIAEKIIKEQLKDDVKQKELVDNMLKEMSVN
jgi:F-type H+-transporting ATPase subunit b